ncbi:MAG: hypothetical protein JO129_02685 [Candidatus Dependentiae bacterium]|nr:hypothetical protein [Candidatus Dependentiae bacterium]
MKIRLNTLIFKSLICIGLLVEAPIMQAAHQPTIVISGALALASTGMGIYNIRHYNQILSQCEFDYQLTFCRSWTEYPLQVAQDVICSNSFNVNTVDRIDHGRCIAEIQKKITFFNSINDQAIWNFEKFKDIFPHIDSHQSYCVSKSYLGLFGYTTLGSLRSAVSHHILKVRDDFNTIKLLTDIPWQNMNIPKNKNEFDKLQTQLTHYHNYYGAYSLLGAFGYSALHNSRRAKEFLIELARIHAFLIQFQELLYTCVDHDETRLINELGLLNFSLQHVHHIKQNI